MLGAHSSDQTAIRTSNFCLPCVHSLLDRLSGIAVSGVTNPGAPLHVSRARLHETIIFSRNFSFTSPNLLLCLYFPAAVCPFTVISVSSRSKVIKISQITWKFCNSVLYCPTFIVAHPFGSLHFRFSSLGNFNGVCQ